MYRAHTHCRVCGERLGAPYLDLGEQPLANALVSPGAPDDKARYPLQVILCERCGLSQLSVVVNPEILYSGYRFRSGASEGWVNHCEWLAKRCTKEWDKFPPGKVLDIAANDGTQLGAFARRGWEARGVDPAPCLTEELRCIVYEGFWSEKMADNIRAVDPPPFDLVIAQNVLNHADDPIGFLRAIKTVLAEDGRVVVEVPNSHEMWDGNAFDTIYHEHLSYWDSWAMEEAVTRAGLQMCRVERLAVHGGSKRYWLQHAGLPRPHWGPGQRMYPNELLPLYAGTFAQRVEENLEATWAILNSCERSHIMGWGAAAKATVYLNAIHRYAYTPAVIEAVIDETPEKQGMLVPGVHIPIIAPPDDLSDVDIIWILAWNWADQITEKAMERGFTGKFLLTNGTPRLES